MKTALGLAAGLSLLVFVGSPSSGQEPGDSGCGFIRPKIYNATVSPVQNDPVVSIGRVHYLAGDRISMALSLPECAVIADVRIASSKQSRRSLHAVLSDKIISRTRLGTRRRVIVSIDLSSLRSGTRDAIQITVQNPQHILAKIIPSVGLVFTVVKLGAVPHPFTPKALLQSQAMSLDDCGLWEDFDVGSGPNVVGGECAGEGCAGLLFESLHPEQAIWHATGERGPSEGCFITEIECPECWPPPPPPPPPPPCEGNSAFEECMTQCMIEVLNQSGGRISGADFYRICLPKCRELIGCRYP